MRFAGMRAQSGHMTSLVGNRGRILRSLAFAAWCFAPFMASGCKMPDGTTPPLPELILNGVGSAVEELSEAAVLTFLL